MLRSAAAGPLCPRALGVLVKPPEGGRRPEHLSRGDAPAACGVFRPSFVCFVALLTPPTNTTTNMRTRCGHRRRSLGV